MMAGCVEPVEPDTGDGVEAELSEDLEPVVVVGLVVFRDADVLAEPLEIVPELLELFLGDA